MEACIQLLSWPASNVRDLLCLRDRAKKERLRASIPKVRSENHAGIYLDCGFDFGADWCSSDLAAQQKVGLLSNRGNWPDPSCSRHFAVCRSDLNLAQVNVNSKQPMQKEASTLCPHCRGAAGHADHEGRCVRLLRSNSRRDCRLALDVRDPAALARALSRVN